MSTLEGLKEVIRQEIGGEDSVFFYEKEDSRTGRVIHRFSVWKEAAVFTLHLQPLFVSVTLDTIERRGEMDPGDPEIRQQYPRSHDELWELQSRLNRALRRFAGGVVA